MKNNAHNLMTSTTLAMAGFGLVATSIQAAIEVPPDHIQGEPTYPVAGTLMAIDEPASIDTDTTFHTGPVGPDWPEDADDGFSVLSGAQIASNEWRANMWEPDGTPDDGDNVSYIFNKPGQSVTWAFDLPDGATVHNVYATWHHQANSGTGHTYTYDEGALTTFTKTAAASSSAASDLVLQWTAADTDTHDAKFQRIFAGDITVAGGDGFVVTFTQNAEGGTAYPYTDAVVIDVTLPPSKFALTITSNATTSGNYDFEWESQDGKVYDLVSDTSLATAPAGWSVWEGQADIVSGGTTTILPNIPGGPDPTRFFAVLEKDPPPLLEEDFEAGLPGTWTASVISGTGTAWEVGDPTGGFASGPPAASSGSKCAGTNIPTNGGAYTASVDIKLTSPSILIPIGSGATLNFQQFIDTDLDGDIGSVRILDADSADAPIAGLEITPIEGDGTGAAWTPREIVMPAGDVGGKNIKIEFQFVSNANVDVWGGFYIDDVVVTGTP